MISNVEIFPQSGFINSNNSVNFNLYNLSNSNGLKITIENATESIILDSFEIESNINSIQKNINLQVSELF